VNLSIIGLSALMLVECTEKSNQLTQKFGRTYNDGLSCTFKQSDKSFEPSYSKETHFDGLSNRPILQALELTQ